MLPGATLMCCAPCIVNYDSAGQRRVNHNECVPDMLSRSVTGHLRVALAVLLNICDRHTRATLVRRACLLPQQTGDHHDAMIGS
jgi:hypothetical protein